jgi:hypothetical protein
MIAKSSADRQVFIILFRLRLRKHAVAASRRCGFGQ